MEFVAIVLMRYVAAADETATQPPVGPAAVTAPAVGGGADADSDDAVLNAAEPDYAVVNLPTGMSLPVAAWLVGRDVRQGRRGPSSGSRPAWAQRSRRSVTAPALEQ